jgi:hypothetical protein
MCALGVAASGLFVPDTVAAATPPDPGVPGAAPFWFAEVRTPISLPGAAEAVLAERVHAAVRRGKADADAFAMLAYDTAPRVVFVSCSTGAETARVNCGGGAGLQAATLDAVRGLLERMPAARKAAWVKVDVVQQVLATPAFQVRDGTVPHPSLIGVAFTADPDFAFLPEQLIAGFLVTPEQQLRVHLVADGLIAGKRWAELGRWNRLTTFPAPQHVCFFESQSVFTDGHGAVPVFRGHRLRESLDAAELIDMAVRAGEFLVRAWADAGVFRPQVPNWEVADETGAELQNRSLAALALFSLHRVTRRDDFRDTAQAILRQVLGDLQSFTYDPQAACIVENASALLSTNAMTALALAQAAAATPRDPEAQNTLLRLGRYLLRQLQPDGDFIAERDHPRGNVQGTRTTVRVSALAIGALAALYEATAERQYLAAAQAGLGFVIRTQIEKQEMDQLPQDEWLVRAMNELFTYSRDRTCVTQCERLALGVLASLTDEPVFPDLLGSIANSPLTTPAAQRTRLLLAAAALLRDNDREQAADRLLSAVSLQLLFQAQAFVDEVAAMYLPDPQAALGAFRSDCMGYAFSLEAQAHQILSLTEAYPVLQAAPGQRLVMAPKGAKAVQACLASSRRFPRVLPVGTPPPAAATANP